MSYADAIYGNLIKDITSNGSWDKDHNVRTVWKDGSPAYTKSILNARMKFDNGSEIPILTQKRVPTRDPINELFWIWKDKSNIVQDLRDVGCSIWNEWEKEDGTIGKAYGYQLGNKYRRVERTELISTMILNGEISSNHTYDGTHVNLDQVDYLIYMLRYNPHSRRIKTSLWGVSDLDDMSLEPCVYDSHWQVWGGKLHLTVNIRSNDMALGNPYNVYQYSILHRLIAQVTGHKVGTIVFNIDNAHIYERHISPLLSQLDNKRHEAPEVWINPDVKSFYDFELNDIKLNNYKHSGSIKMEVAI